MKDKVGEKYGRLIVISFDKKIIKNKNYRYYWICKCDCGKEKSVCSSNLLNKHTLSCGCFKKEQIIKANVIHGKMLDSRKHINEFNSWKNMVSRCTNLNNNRYYMYGAKGITICDEWLKDFHNFLKDMGIKPDKTYSIDRIDGAKGYYKDNCRWATSKEQANNRINNKKQRNNENSL